MIMTNEYFKQGFTKRAQEEGFSRIEAAGLFKLAIDPRNPPSMGAGVNGPFARGGRGINDIGQATLGIPSLSGIGAIGNLANNVAAPLTPYAPVGPMTNPPTLEQDNVRNIVKGLLSDVKIER